MNHIKRGPKALLAAALSGLFCLAAASALSPAQAQARNADDDSSATSPKTSALTQRTAPPVQPRGDVWLGNPTPEVPVGGDYWTAVGYEIHMDGRLNWLTAFTTPSGVREWCINLFEPSPTGPGTPAPATANPVDGLSAGLRLSDAEMGFLLETVGQTGKSTGSVEAHDNIAAVSLLVHANYEEGAATGYVQELARNLDTSEKGRALHGLADHLADYARKNADSPKANATGKVDKSKQAFQVTNIGVTVGGEWVAGVPVTLTMKTDHAVFDQTQDAGGQVSKDGKQWTGKTLAAPLAISGRSTSNGKVETVAKFSDVWDYGVGQFQRPTGAQSTLYAQKHKIDPSVPTDPEEVVYDFAPILVSSVADAGSKVVAPGEPLSDQVVVSADTNYTNSQWLGKGGTYPGNADYEPLEVTFVGNAYLVGETPVAPSQQIPDDAKLVGSAEIVAAGPSTHKVTVPAADEPGFVVWQWEMQTKYQPQVASEDLYMLAGDWADTFGLAAEQSVHQFSGSIETNLKVYPTNNNTYLVDDVFVTGLPEDHPNFAGGAGFGADKQTIAQNLYFWPDGNPDAITSTDDAELICTLTVPAKNGFYPSQGGTQCKAVMDSDGKLAHGVYQVVHSFEGDDRVAAFESPIPDPFEQFLVDGEPAIGTTAQGEDGKEIEPGAQTKLTDTVCYTDLKPGKEYELEGSLMHQTTGKKVLGPDGSPVVAKTVFTPEAANGCVDVVFTFDSWALAGSSVVVFEDLWADGEVVAAHADINDLGQTVWFKSGPELPETGLSGSLQMLAGALGLLAAGAGLLAARGTRSRAA